jgi:NAD(P)-dependent dehydrogenase (short-subunit alcohol dehydrogenase family)
MKKNVLITGASGNLGKATVTKFLNDGYKVLATVSPGKSMSFHVNGDLQIYEADLTDEESTDAVVRNIIKEHSTIDAALLLVGGYAAGGIHETDLSALSKMFSLNFYTTYFVARPVFQHMLTQKNGGRLVFIGSRPALKPAQGKSSLAYALAKSLLFKLADFLNSEGSGKNVTASVIVPSTIDTDANRQAMPDKDFSAWVKPEDIAECMSFLCSDNGKTLREAVLKIYGRA